MSVEGRGTSPLLQDVVYRRTLFKRKFMLWLRRILVVLGASAFFAGVIFAVQSGSSKQVVRLLSEQRFPFDALLLEGIPGYSQPQRAKLDAVRQQGVSLGMFLLTGVNVTDSRTFFFSYFSPPPQGPAWIGWAYNPKDPEFEGSILEQDPNGAGTSGTAGNGTESQPDAKTGSLETRGVLVGIYHTHNGESYTGDGGPERKAGNGDVVTVGTALQAALAKNGVQAVQSTTVHDSVDFMKAYVHSAETVGKMMKDYPSLQLLLDVHRDGLPPGVSKSTVNIKGKEAAKILIVIGKVNPHWQKNAELAKELIALGEQKYPGLFVNEISYADDARYNQHFSNGGLLLEFGSQLNTLGEAKVSAEAAAEVIGEWLKKKG